MQLKEKNVEGDSKKQASLGGGFKHFSFSSLFVEDGWFNQKLVKLCGARMSN